MGREKFRKRLADAGSDHSFLPAAPTFLGLKQHAPSKRLLEFCCSSPKKRPRQPPSQEATSSKGEAHEAGQTAPESEKCAPTAVPGRTGVPSWLPPVRPQGKPVSMGDSNTVASPDETTADSNPAEEPVGALSGDLFAGSPSDCTPPPAAAAATASSSAGSPPPAAAAVAAAASSPPASPPATSSPAAAIHQELLSLTCQGAKWRLPRLEVGRVSSFVVDEEDFTIGSALHHFGKLDDALAGAQLYGVLGRIKLSILVHLIKSAWDDIRARLTTRKAIQSADLEKLFLRADGRPYSRTHVHKLQTVGALVTKLPGICSCNGINMETIWNNRSALWDLIREHPDLRAFWGRDTEGGGPGLPEGFRFPSLDFDPANEDTYKMLLTDTPVSERSLRRRKREASQPSK